MFRRVPSVAPVVPAGTSARSTSTPLDSVLCTKAIVSEGTELAEALVIKDAIVTEASVIEGEDVTDATVVEDTDVPGTLVVESKDEAEACVTRVKGIRRLGTGFFLATVSLGLTTIDFIGSISTFRISVAIGSTFFIIIFARFRSCRTSNA